MKSTKSFLRECLNMKNGNVQEFVDHIHYGDELWFLYNDTKYFLEGWIENDIFYAENNILMLLLRFIDNKKIETTSKQVQWLRGCFMLYFYR